MKFAHHPVPACGFSSSDVASSHKPEVYIRLIDDSELTVSIETQLIHSFVLVLPDDGICPNPLSNPEQDEAGTENGWVEGREHDLWIVLTYLGSQLYKSYSEPPPATEQHAWIKCVLSERESAGDYVILWTGNKVMSH